MVDIFSANYVHTIDEENDKILKISPGEHLLS